MRITNPMGEQIYEAYCELFAAIENGINNDNFFLLREQFRNIQSQVCENEDEQKGLEAFRAHAREKHNDDGNLEVDETAVVSVSEDGGAYVAAWIWIPEEAVSSVGEGADD